MPASLVAHDIADRLREYAAKLECEVKAVYADESTVAQTSLPVRKREVVQAWGTLVGEALDEAFGTGVLSWEHYATLKADEAEWKRADADWYYRLFLATTSNIAMSDAETGGVTAPGFLCSRCRGWGSCRVLENAQGVPTCSDAIRKVADIMEANC